jgi:20S proteasome alpha/beta subunit
MFLAALLVALSGYQYGGTFIGAVICSDGIVIASDSRTTFMDGDGKAFAFLDGMQKIYVDHDTAVAISGLSSLDGELFSSFVDRNRFLLARPVNEILFGFLLYTPFANATGIAMISAGFLNGQPTICAKAPTLEQTCSSVGFISSKNSPLLREALSKLNRAPTMAEAAAALKAAIEESSRSDSTVGGPVSILRLTSGGAPVWTGAPPSDGGITQICDLVRKRHADIVATASQRDLDFRLKAACPDVR